MKTIGCCSICSEEVFDIAQRDATGKATQVGAPHDTAQRATFVLKDGHQMDLTLCWNCLSTLNPEQFSGLWQSVMAAWVGESGSLHPWVKSQLDNGILGLMHARPWKDVMNG